MDVHHQTRSEGRFAPIDSERASIAMRLVMMCGEFIKAGEPQKALEAYHHARDILDGLADSQRHNVDLGLTLSLLHRRIGDLMRAQGNGVEAKEAYRSSLAIAERLAAFHPGNQELRRNQAEALAALSAVSDTIGFGPKFDSAIERLNGFPSLHEALASAADSRVKASAPAAERPVAQQALAERRVGARSLGCRKKPGLCSNRLSWRIFPRKMRVGALEKVEVRIDRPQEADATTVRLRAPEGGFLIDPLSPETCWTDEKKGDGNEYASWRWIVTPQRRGKVPLRLIISAKTLDANGVTAEAALPDQVIKVSVRGDHGRTARRVAVWGLLMLSGGALNAWGRELYRPALEAVEWLWGLLQWWPL